MFGSIGMPELILIFVVALLVFGPRKLPEIGKSIGKGLAEFKRASEDLKKTIEQEIEEGKSEISAVGREVSAAADTIARIPAAAPPAGPAEGDRPEAPIRPA
ncbi:MAG: twin-arginine translocase TatA/TatE family subunit [Thermoanaerobaculia bacterium]